MGDSKRTLETEMAISHVNCGTYCTFAGYDEQNNINLYQCVNCKRTFMLTEFVSEPEHTEQQPAETQPQQDEQPQNSEPAENEQQPEQKGRRKRQQ